MRTPLFIFLPLLFAFSYSMAQEPVTVYFDHKDQPCAADTAFYKKTGTKEQDGRWHVLQSVLTSDQPFAEGYYPDPSFLHGDGLFIYYYDYKEKKVREKGPYKNGEKDGQWTYYYHNGRPSAIDSMQAGKRISSTCFDENGNPSQQYCGLEVESFFPGGQPAWLKYLVKKMSNAAYPKEYFDGKIYGQVVVQFIIDENGKVTDVQVIGHVDPKLDQIALETITASPKWNPAIQYNRHVKSYKKQPIDFPKYPGSK